MRLIIFLEKKTFEDSEKISPPARDALVLRERLVIVLTSRVELKNGKTREVT